MANVEHTYDRIRAKGVKHSVAVTETAAALFISSSEVRRVLAKWRPKSAQIVLRFEPIVWNKEHRLHRKWLRKELAKRYGYPVNRSDRLPKDSSVFQFRYGVRPEFPRFNAKPPEK